MPGYFNDRRRGNGGRVREPGPRICAGCGKPIRPKRREVEAIRMTWAKCWVDGHGLGRSPHATRSRWYHLECWPKLTARHPETADGRRG